MPSDSKRRIERDVERRDGGGQIGHEARHRDAVLEAGVGDGAPDARLERAGADERRCETRRPRRGQSPGHLDDDGMAFHHAEPGDEADRGTSGAMPSERRKPAPSTPG